MTIHPKRAKRFAKRVLREVRKSSYRKVIPMMFPMKNNGDYVVKPGTLNRIVKSCGEYLPKESEKLIALGLKKPRKPRKTLMQMNQHELADHITKQVARINNTIQSRGLKGRIGWIKE